MAEELDLETYLCISPNEFEIYLFNKTNLKNLYEDKIRFNNNSDYFNFNLLDKFLEKNIFKIEKFAGNFIKNIFLIIDNKEIKEVNFGIKKKSYENIIGKNFLQNILTDAKDLFRENYQNDHIMHILINRYFESGNYHLSFKDEFSGDYLCVEFQFKCISDIFISEIIKVLGKYQVALSGCLDSNYIKNYFVDQQLEYTKMIYKIQNGFNENEVKLISKNLKKTGFFEKFFQLFS
tara:strand:- start:2639 stop:3343 length:705 start_codon:yes stop_codon:yes gene_type:complete